MSVDRIDPTVRFDGRADDYERFRPGYPAQAIRLLSDRGLVGKGTCVADIGSGTGILTAMLLELGAIVYAVEPNPGMRRKAEARFSGVGNFISVPGTAESTGLSASSIDLVTAGQSFHWFDPEGSREEFLRILRPGGKVMLLWNNRAEGHEDFNADYGSLLASHGLDTSRGSSKEEQEAAIVHLFAGRFERFEFDYDQRLDLESVMGRLRSSSYCPRPDSPGFEPLMMDVANAFRTHQKNGTVLLRYRTEVYLGEME